MKTIFFDNYNTSLLRVDSLSDVYNHSQLVVAPGTVAYISDGGDFSGPFLPGIHTLQTEIGWFRNGARGRSMTVYRIGSRERYYCKSGTGLFYFKSPDIPITRSARAPYTLAVKVANGDLFIEKVLGYHPKDVCQTLDQFFTFHTSEVVQHALRSALNRQEIQEVHLPSVASTAARELRPIFRAYGIELVSLTISELNLVENTSFAELESEVAKLKVLCGGDKYFYLQHLMVAQGKATPSDLMALGSMMPQQDAALPDTWGGI